MKIEIDDEGYPTEQSLHELEAWTGTADEIPVVLDAVADYFNGCGYGTARRLGDGYWSFATGGWSGCEEVLSVLPLFVRALAWQSTSRGGLHIFRVGR